MSFVCPANEIIQVSSLWTVFVLNFGVQSRPWTKTNLSREADTREEINTTVGYYIRLIYLLECNAWVSLFILLSIVKVYTFCVSNTYSPFGGPGRSLAAIDDVTIMDIPVDSR